MENNLKIYPSLLSANFLNLEEEIRNIELSGASGLHIDVMDGHFVPNLTFGPGIVSSIRSATSLFLDVHLMTYPSNPWILRFISIGVDRITFHPNTEDDAKGLLLHIKSNKIQAGIAIAPDDLMPSWLLPFCDSVLVMTVHPGFSGQTFIESSISKISKIREMAPHLEICVDGGITDHTSKIVKNEGADSVVVGKFFFDEENKDIINALAYKQKIKTLQWK